MAAGAYVQLLGQPVVRVGNHSIDFLPNKRFQLLAYLAYQNDWVSRGKLAFLFWPDETDHTARHNLRQLLKHVRKMDWLSGFEADENRLRWQVETDAAFLKEALRDDDIEKMLSLYQGSLLPNLEGSGEGEFGDWLVMEREGFHGRWREALLSKVVELESSEQFDLAGQLLRTLLERDPLDEAGLQAYMRSALKAGHRDQALSAYRAFAKRLQAELEIEPTSTTEQLAKEIEEAPPLPSPRQKANASDTLSPLPKRSAAVATAIGVALLLPKPATSFVGRDLEIAEVVHILSQEDCRLLTLAGAGGVGKTRLALQAAQEVGKNYPDGVYFVALDSLTSAASIPTTLAATLGIELQGLEEPLTQISRFLESKRILLLDNYEHLLEGATVTSELLQVCPELTLLVTSRERLNLEEEWLLSVQGLSYPTDGSRLERASAHDAVQLFVRRAQRVLRGFSLTEVELPHVLEVCRLVQGFPLGIELAAAWVRVMLVSEIAREIGRNYDFLSSTSRNLSDRHRSIRAAFEHSWQLLSDKEQDVLRKLSVFKGGFRKDAATFVAGASYTVLAALLDKSLLRVSPDGRYDRHPLVYQYTLEKLKESSEESEVRRRHAQFFLAFAERVEPELHGPEQVKRLGHLEDEHDNLRVMLQWAHQNREAELALRLVGALGWFWSLRGHRTEGREQFTKVLSWTEAAERTAARAKALTGAGHLAYWQGDLAVVPSLFEESLTINCEIDNKPGIASSLNALGMLVTTQGNYPLARSLLEESLSISQELKDRWAVASSFLWLGRAAYFQGDYGSARSLLEEALEMQRALGDKWGISSSLFQLGEVAFEEGDYGLARSLYEESLAIDRELGDRWGMVWLFHRLGLLAYHQQDYNLAHSLLRESAVISKEVGSKIGVATALEGLAQVEMAHGKLERAACLWGIASTFREATHTRSYSKKNKHRSLSRVEYEHHLASIRTDLGEAGFAVAWAKGQAMSLGQAIDYVLEQMD